jgi:hypothetical protein
VTEETCQILKGLSLIEAEKLLAIGGVKDQDVDPPDPQTERSTREGPTGRCLRFSLHRVVPEGVWALRSVG